MTGFGIQTRITIFIVAVVVSVLSVSTYLSRTWTEEKAEENLRERYINIVKQIDASITSRQELRDSAVLKRELTKLLDVRPNIVSVRIFDLTTPEPRLTAERSRSGNPERSSPSPEEVDSIRGGEVLARLETGGDDRFWDILAPVRIQKEVQGMIRARISTREYDTIVVQERRQAFGVTATAAVVILLFLVWYLRKTITGPIRTLVEAMTRAEAGDLESRAEIEARDEVGRLADQFNRMLGTIRENSVRILHFNDELKERVHQATAELNRKYEELTALNRQLNQVQLRLVDSERLAAAGQVAAEVAHRIGTPLHSILGHLDRMEREVEGERPRERLGIIRSQVERVVGIIREMLDSVRGPGGKTEPVQVNALLEELVHLVTPGAALRGIRMETDLEPTLPTVSGDAGQLQESLLNLFTNAIDAMPDGGILRVTTRLDRSHSRVGSAIRVTVEDTGYGIPEEDLPKIFEPFFTSKERGRGTGLGLAICRDLIRNHGGEIRVSSRRGEGTVFTVTFPVENPDAT